MESNTVNCTIPYPQPSTTTTWGQICSGCGVWHSGVHTCLKKTTVAIDVSFDEEKLDRLLEKLTTAVELLKEIKGLA